MPRKPLTFSMLEDPTVVVDFNFLIDWCRAQPAEQLQEYFQSNKTTKSFGRWVGAIPDIETFREFLQRMPANKISIIVQGLSEQLSRYFIMSSQLISILIVLDPAQQKEWINCLKTSGPLQLFPFIERESTSDGRARTKMAVFKGILQWVQYHGAKHMTAVCAVLSSTELLQMVETIADLRELTRYLSDGIYTEVISSLVRDNRYLGMIKTVEDMKSLLPHLTLEQIKTVCVQQDALIQSAKFASIFEYPLVEEQFKVIYGVWHKKVVITVDKLAQIMHYYPQHKDYVFSKLTNADLIRIVEKSEDLVKILPYLSPEQSVLVCTEKCALITTSFKELIAVLLALKTSEPFLAVYALLQSQCSSLLNRSFDINRVFYAIDRMTISDKAQRQLLKRGLMQALSDDKLLTIILIEADLTIIQVLEEERRHHILNLLHTSGWIVAHTNTVEEFNQVMYYLLPEDRSVVCAMRKDWLFSQAAEISGLNDFLRVLAMLPLEYCKVVCETQKQRLVGMIDDIVGFCESIKDHFRKKPEERAIVFLALQDCFFTHISTKTQLMDVWGLLNTLTVKHSRVVEEDLASWEKFCRDNLLLNFFILAKRVGIDDLTGLISGLTANRQRLMSEVITEGHGYPLLINALKIYAETRKKEPKGVTFFKAEHKQQAAKVQAVERLVAHLSLRRETVISEEAEVIVLSGKDHAALRDSRCGEIISAWEKMVKRPLNLSSYSVSHDEVSVELATLNPHK